VTDTAVESIPAATDNERMKAHFVCGLCYPEEVPMGTPSLCGERVLGRRPPPGYVACQACHARKHAHALRHMMGGR
jgi:hypothetical protein